MATATNNAQAQGKVSSKGPAPPCQAACPVHTDTQGYVRLIAWGRFTEALELVRKVNPFPSVCGRICQHPCEQQCRRSSVDTAIALKELKRFITEVEAGSGWTPEKVPVTLGKVAVIGAGPSGLTAAQDLRNMGYAVTVYERLAQPGGMLNLIPKYRLPEHVLRRDIDTILARGLELVCKVETGRDILINDLKAEGFEAIIGCTGLSRSRGLALPGFGAERFIAAIPFMMDVWSGSPVEVGRRALVIGGGNVAIDVARTLRRLGAAEVAVTCVESRAEMPASEEEIADAVEEGILLMPSWAPKRVLRSGQRVAGIELMRVTSVFDENGRFNPKYDPNHLKVATADTIVLTIGQTGDTSWVRGSGVALDGRGRVISDRELHTTSEPGVFLAGEARRGPGNVIEAIAEGHRVASIADSFLRTGKAAAPTEETGRLVGGFTDTARANVRRIERVRMPRVDSAVRLEGFLEHDLGYTEVLARREAARCLNCGAGPSIDEDKCAFCLTCMRVCPLDGIEIARKMTAVAEACQACGLCAAECPRGAITLGHWEKGNLLKQFTEARGAHTPESVVIRCIHAQDGSGEEVGAEHPSRLGVPCVTHLTALDLFALVAKGVKRIELVMCAEDSCKHPQSRARSKQVLSAAAERIAASRPGVEIVLSELRPQNAVDSPPEGATE